MKKLVLITILLSGIAHATPISDALVGCLLSSQTQVKSVAIDHPTVKKISVDGKDDVVFGLTCAGAAAETLYREASKLGGYDHGEAGYGYFERVWADGSTVRTIHLGNGMSNNFRSGCHNKVIEGNGTPANYYWCNLLIDIKRDLLANLDLNSTIKTEIKQEAPKGKVSKKKAPAKKAEVLP